LWQKTDENYKKHNSQSCALANVDNAVDLEDSGVPGYKQKIKIISTHYCQELTKISTTIILRLFFK
jgi:hypothetical protein